VPIFFGQELFKCGCPHFLLQKQTSNFSKFIVFSHLTWTGGREEQGIEPVLTILSGINLTVTLISFFVTRTQMIGSLQTSIYSCIRLRSYLR